MKEGIIAISSKDSSPFFELSARIAITSIKDGLTLYSHDAWADDINGGGFSLEYVEGKEYRGIVENIQSPEKPTNPSVYTWTKWTGADGHGLNLKGEKDSVDDLPTKGELGDVWYIQGYMWYWNGKQWMNVGKIKGEDGAQGEQGEQGENGISCVILSTGGTIFKNGEGSSTLTVKLYQGGEEVDSEGTGYEYRWEKWSDNTKDDWSATGKSINVDQNHINVSTTFIVKVGTAIQGQITIVDLNDTIVSLVEPTQKIIGTQWHNLNDNKTYIWTGVKWELTTPTVVVGANNKVRNGNFAFGYKHYINSTYVIDNDIKYENSLAIGINVEEATEDIDSKLETIFMPITEGVPLSAQAKCMIPSTSLSQSDFYFNIDFYNINKTYISQQQYLVDKNLKDIWQLIKMENISPPNTAKYAKLSFVLKRNGQSYVTELQLETSTSCSDFRVSSEDTLEGSTELFNIVNSISEKITDDSITRIVMQSTELADTLGGKADVSDLNGLLTQEDLNNANQEMQNYIDKQIGGIPLTSFVEKTEFQQTMKDFLFNFTQGGGVNLFLNSLGLAPNNYAWTIANAVRPIENGDISRLGFSSGWHFNSTTRVNVLRQTVALNPNKEYTISFFIKKPKNVRFQIETYDGVDTTHPRKDYVVPTDTEFNYEYVYFNLVPTNTSMTFILANHGTSGGSNVMITGLMLNQGKLPFTWKPHPTETYNGSTKVDINGIRVNRLNGEDVIGYTEMTPTQFAGYNRNATTGQFERTFALLGEYTLANKLIARDEINVGSLKMVKVNNDNHVGVAFVALAKEFEVE